MCLEQLAGHHTCCAIHVSSAPLKGQALKTLSVRTVTCWSSVNEVLHSADDEKQCYSELRELCIQVLSGCAEQPVSKLYITIAKASRPQTLQLHACWRTSPYGGAIRGPCRMAELLPALSTLSTLRALTLHSVEVC
jgi:hypothetical protein